MKRWLSVFLLFLFCRWGVAQTNRPVSLQFFTEKYSYGVQHVLCDTDGVCTCYLEDFGLEDTLKLHVTHYNTSLQMLRDTSLRIAASMTRVADCYDRHKAYFLYQNKDKKKVESTGMIVVYNCQTEELLQYSVANLPTGSIKNFQVRENHLFFTCDVNKNNENIFFMTLPEKESPIFNEIQYARALYIKNAPDYEVNDYLFDTLAQKTIICINTSSHTRNNVLWLCETTPDGEVQFVVDLPDTASIRFQNARMTKMSDNRYLLLGTYQGRKNGLSNTADGVYSLIYENRQFYGQQTFAYKKIAVPNTGYTMNTELMYLPGKIFADSTHFAFVTESFYPEYRYSTTYAYGMPTTEPIFVGYRFINADIKVFDTLGNMAWEYTFPFDNMMLTNLTPHIRISYLQDEILFYFVQKKSLVTMLTNNSLEIIDPIRETDIFPNEKGSSMESFSAVLQPWYEQNYMLSGYKFYQKGSNKGKASMYFMNKMRYQ